MEADGVVSGISEEWRGRRVLVTGGTGFIGAELVRRLDMLGADVRGMSRGAGGRDNWIVGDVRDRTAVMRAVQGREIVFHAAALDHDPDLSPHLYEEVNTRGSVLMGRAAAASGCSRFIFFSSVKAMGEETPGGPEDEDATPSPRTPYGRSKLEAERRLGKIDERTAMAVICLRLPLVYAPGAGRTFGRLVRAIARGLFPPPPMGTSKRSMVALPTVVEAALRAASGPRPPRSCYILADETGYTAREIYDSVRRAAGRSSVRWHVPLWMFKAVGLVGSAARSLGLPAPVSVDEVRKLFGPAVYVSSRIREDLALSTPCLLDELMPEIVGALEGGASHDLDPTSDGVLVEDDS